MQAQSATKAHRQKWYYDQKIGAVNLKPGDLVLVNADTCRGKRKIQDRWEDGTYKVVHQIVTGIPAYKVKDQHRRSCTLQWNCLLVVSEVGIPLCIGICHAWDRCTSLTHASLLPWEVKMDRCHKSTVVVQTPNALPARLPWGGSI